MNGRPRAAIQRERHGIIDRCCATCNLWKPLSAYGARSKTGWNARCKTCERTRSASRRLADGRAPRAPAAAKVTGCLLQELWRGVPQED